MPQLQIILNVDPLKSDELPSLGLGIFQSLPITRRLPVPILAGDFYCFKTMNGFELGVDANWLIEFLQSRITETDNQLLINGKQVIIESLKAGDRWYNVDQLTIRGNAKFGFFYKLAREIPANETTFWLSLFG